MSAVGVCSECLQSMSAANVCRQCLLPIVYEHPPVDNVPSRLPVTPPDKLAAESVGKENAFLALRTQSAELKLARYHLPPDSSHQF